MRLNAVEKALMNNPVRAGVQRLYEARVLTNLGGLCPGARVLEIGCGRGVGTEIVLEHFGAREVVAFDLDPDMVERSARRLQRYGADRVTVAVGDATAIDAESQSFDAVFDFGVIHHVPSWRDAIAEVARVLRPGGRFYFEEVTRHALDRWSYRTFLDHPTSDRFGGQELVAALEKVGVKVGNNYVERFFGDFVIGVGRRHGMRSSG
jgi:ubiquinone/menaquinone biosynthesis C-methylase UbiE